MALIFTESFEFITSGSPAGGSGIIPADKWNLANLDAAVWSGQGPRTGSLNVTGASPLFIGRQVEAANEHATFTLGVAITGGPGTSKKLLSFRSDSGATEHVYVQTKSSDQTILEVYRAGSPTLLGATATGALPASGGYHYLEAQVTLSDTVGAVTLRVDETAVLTLTSQDTKNAGTKTVFDSFYLVFANNGVVFYDDFYATNGAGSSNAGFLGAVKIEALLPTGNGNTSGMTNDAGNSTNNYSHVNDTLGTAPSTGSYVDGVTTGDKDTYAMADSAQPTANSVKAVVVYNYAEKTDAGARGLNTVTRLSGTEATVATQALTNGAFHLVWGVHETKPGGGAWTVADYNSAEVGQAAT